MKPRYANIQDIPAGVSLSAIRAQRDTVRSLMKGAVEDDAGIIDKCTVRIKAASLVPGLMFEFEGREFFFPVNNKWFKQAKAELATCEALARSVKNRDRT